ncbi:MAG: beta-glucosidase family protein [Flavisolibacter sp.]
MKNLVIVVALFFAVSINAQEKGPQLGKASVKEVIGAMTLEEKAHMVVGMGFRMPGSSGPVVGRTEDKVPGAAGTTFAIPRLGIPKLVLADGPAGVRIEPYRNKDSSRSYFATAWPVATLLASTWDTALVRKAGAAFGNEIHNYGIDIILAPALNIHRNPLGGRNFEYYSEDPLVAGSIAAAMVNGIQSNGVGTSIKHFAANNQETNRNTINTFVSERALREIYLKAFQITIQKSNPWTVMSSYNKINGTYTSEERDLLTTILRDEWHFKGFVMTDWFGGKDPIAQMNAGNDLLMPGTPQQVKKIMDAVQHDSLDIKMLDQNIEHILNIVVQSPAFKKYAYSDKPDLKAHAAISRRTASEGIILLKNNGALPFKVKKLALFGNTSYDLIAGGTGSGDVHKAYTVSLIEGLSNGGFSLDKPLKESYSSYLSEAKAKRPKPRSFFEQPAPIAEMSIDKSLFDTKASEDDAAIIAIGRNAGEGADRKLENDYYLSLAEKELIQNVSSSFHAKGKKVVVLLNIGGVIEVASWRDMADGIVLAWQPGLEAGNVITDILDGKVNPSGKLATTFPIDYKDVPSSSSFPGKETGPAVGNGPFKQAPAEVSYNEGIYVGYRYYTTFQVKPAYEFGFGLSYTKFTYCNFKLNSSFFNGKVTASITVTNSGRVSGKEIIQLYIQAPGKTMDKPSEELKAFAKTELLAPGKSQTITFNINASDLASFDTGRTSWIAEPGAYILKVGASSEDIKKTGSFTLSKEIIVEKDHKVLVPQVELQEMKKSF